MDQKRLSRVIGDILRKRSRKCISEIKGPYRHAGVLVPLLVENGQAAILFTKRTDRVEHHKGQISFPGGATDEEDGSIEETALRETYEEIGLQKDQVEVLGRIDDALTLASNFIIHPIVGIVPYPYEFRLNRAEVKRLIKVPLDVFDRVNSGTRKGYFQFEGKSYSTPTFKYDGEVIWGATAKIMENFMDIVGLKLLLPEDSK